MKTLILDIDESIYKQFLSFVETLPKEKIKIFDKIDDSHIPYVSDEEQKEIDEILKDPDTKVIVESKNIKI
ncbi:MAG: hypothetical protein M3R36_13835 [Bacteroidota bacterium]|nr:hypothetical protein [Bacteroidota bacterium]